MAPLAVHIKHAGKVHDVQLDPDLPPNVFKDAVYQATGVPVDRMKVMVKGGVLKVCTQRYRFHPLFVDQDARMTPIGRRSRLKR